MSQLLPQLQADLNASRKARDKPATLVLGTIISDVKNREIELERAITDEDAVEVIRRGIKRRREAIEMFDKGNRPELAAKERAEVVLLERYLPAGPSADDIRVAARAAIASGASNVGSVMAIVMPQFKGRADGGTINSIVREELSKPG